MRVAAGLGVAAAALSVVATVASLAQAGRSATVLDRTFRCTLDLEDSVRTLGVSTYAGSRVSGSPDRWRSVAHANLMNGALSDGSLAGVGAGRPAPRDGSAALWVNARRCRAANARVRLTTRGLPVGGAASQFGDVYECQVGRTILIRIRAELARPSRLRREAPGTLITRAPVLRSTLAARTEAGKQLALATVSETGRARLHVQPDCLPD
jgi:hypothetical protein